ncbi:unnamed protein product [Dicrocoelium dendriticum]|nr:unnamed protein product [Dicrocoelium dendriticum]
MLSISRQESTEKEIEHNMKGQQEHLNKLKEQADRLEEKLTQIRMFTEHLYNKLCMVRIASKRDRPHPSARSKELAIELSPVDMLDRCLDLQGQLEKDLEDYDPSEEEEKLEDAMSESIQTREEYQLIVERRIPTHAVRVTATDKTNNYVEFDDGGQEAVTRETIKQRAMMIVEHAKRKAPSDVRRKGG